MNEPKLQFALPREVERLLEALGKLYAGEGRKDQQELIVNSRVRVVEGWSRDNWNGGTYGHALYLTLPEVIFLKIVERKNDLQTEIRHRLNQIHNVQNEFIEVVFLELEQTQNADWRHESGVLIPTKRVVAEAAQNRIWETGCFRLFLSHKCEVKSDAAQLKQRLRRFGISAFVAHEDILPTEEWQKEIENALATMDALVALLTEGFHDSDWTDQEVGYGFGIGVPIIAVKLGKVPYGFIGKFQALSCTWDNAPKEIVKLLIRRAGMIDAFIQAVKDCGTFEHGNILSEMLPFLENLSDNQAENLVNAVNANGQASSSFGFTGEKPNLFGKGVAFHLSRATTRRYGRSEHGIIKVLA